jgi:hypothetical protein
MTTFDGRTHGIRVAPPAAVRASITVVKTRFIDLWPIAMVAVGVLLSLIWSAGLLLLVLFLLFLVV